MVRENAKSLALHSLDRDPLTFTSDCHPGIRWPATDFITLNTTTDMKTINDINFKGKRALIRVDFNVPLDKSLNVTDENRIRATIPTLKKILNDGGSCILMSHLGRPKEGPEDKFSLRHTIKKTEELLGKTVQFGGDCIGDEGFKLSSNLKPGEVLLLENLRFYKQEEKGDVDF